MFCRPPVPKSSASILFLFLAIVGTLILASVVVSSGVERQKIMNELPGPTELDASSALPASSGGAVRRLDLDVAGESVILFAYRENDRPTLGIVQWDRRAGDYVLRSRIWPRGEHDLPKLPRLKLRVLTGWSDGAIVEVSWPLAERGQQAVAYFKIQGTEIEQIPLQRPDGECRLEMLAVGDTGDGQAELMVRDFDDDGVAELLHTTTDSTGDRSIDAFLWVDDKLTWNQYWSQAMTTRADLFP